MTPQALLAGAVRAHEAGRLKEAERLYRQTLSLEPGHADAASNLALVAAQAGRFGEAEAIIGGVLQRLPAHVPALVNLALILQQQKKHGEAIACCERALKLAPDKKSRQKLQKGRSKSTSVRLTGVDRRVE